MSIFELIWLDYCFWREKLVSFNSAIHSVVRILRKVSFLHMLVVVLRLLHTHLRQRHFRLHFQITLVLILSLIVILVNFSLMLVISLRFSRKFKTMLSQLGSIVSCLYITHCKLIFKIIHPSVFVGRTFLIQSWRCCCWNRRQLRVTWIKLNKLLGLWFINSQLDRSEIINTHFSLFLCRIQTCSQR